MNGATQQTENKQFIASLVSDLWTTHNADAWDSYCAESYVVHHGLPDVPENKAGIKQLSKNLFDAFPDSFTDVTLLLAYADLVVQRSTTSATHSGRYKAIPPSGKPYMWHSTHVYRIDDGKILEQWSEERLEGLLWQLEGSHAAFNAPDQKPLHKVIATSMKGLARLVQGKSLKGRSLEATEAHNLKVVGEFVQQFKNEQKYWVFPRLFDHRFSHHFDFPGLASSLDTFISVGQGFLPAFANLNVELQMLIADGDFVVERNTASGTHTGAWVGIQPTGRNVTWSEIHIYRLENGKIIENWPLVNFERILMQLR